MRRILTATNVVTMIARSSGLTNCLCPNCSVTVLNSPTAAAATPIKNALTCGLCDCAFWQEQSHNPQVKAFLIGVAAAAVGLLSTVTLQLGHKQFVKPLDLAIIVTTFVAVSILRIPLYIVLLV